jgi:hypothetical protein
MRARRSSTSGMDCRGQEVSAECGGVPRIPDCSRPKRRGARPRRGPPSIGCAHCLARGSGDWCAAYGVCTSPTSR